MRTKLLGIFSALIIFGLADYLLPPCLGAQKASTSIPELTTIIEKMSEAQTQIREEHRPYIVTRDYQLYGKDPNKPRTEVIAQIEYLPPNTKKYDIRQTSGGIGENVVRRVLDHEVKVTKDPRGAEMSGRNYDFDYLGEDHYSGHRCYLLEAQPKRNDKELLKATVWVDANNFRIRKIEGTPQKNPSWWVHEVHLTLLFSDVAGMWLQTGIQATAQVRFTGPYHLVSEDIGLEAASVVAAKRKLRWPREERQQHPSPAVNVGTLIAK